MAISYESTIIRKHYPLTFRGYFSLCGKCQFFLYIFVPFRASCSYQQLSNAIAAHSSLNLCICTADKENCPFLITIRRFPTNIVVHAKKAILWTRWGPKNQNANTLILFKTKLVFIFIGRSERPSHWIEFCFWMFLAVKLMPDVKITAIFRVIDMILKYDNVSYFHLIRGTFTDRAVLN